MTRYVCIEVNTLHRTIIKATSPQEAIDTLYRRIPTATNARAAGDGFIHYNSTNGLWKSNLSNLRST